MNLKNLFALMVFATIILLATSCQDDDLLDSTSLNNPIDLKTDNDNSFRKRVCLSQEHTKHLMQDPAYKAKREKAMSAFEKLNERNFKAACTAPVLVPVAVHFQGATNPNEACLRQLAITQINTLNDDYAGSNSDINKWTGQAASYFPGVSHGESCIKFVIADQNHPSGYGLSNGDLAITINRTQGDQVNQWAGYANIYVQFNTGALGYAPLGGNGSGDGVVIDATAFGSGSGCGSIAPEAPFNLGRTLTHEMGHYLLLDHIWGDGCGIDDEVSDTPDQANDHSGCPSFTTSTCGSTDMHMNYMDYTNDACMYMFSAGQASRMANYLASSLSNLTSNVSNVYSGSSNGGDDNTGDDNTGDDDSNTGGDNNSGDDSNTGGDDNTGGNDNTGGDDTAACVSPTSSTVQELSLSSVLVDWADAADAIRYQVRYRIVGSTQWTKKTGANSQKRLNDLFEDTYEYQLRTRCSDGWQPWSATANFDLGVEDTDNNGGDDTTEAGDGSFKIQVTLDDYGSETTWELYDESNNLLKQGGPYQDGKAGVVKTKTVTLVDGCYEVDLYDAYGDGICCDYGDGSFAVIDGSGQEVVRFDGNFGTYELVAFCVENGKARITRRDRDAKKSFRGKKK